MDAVKTAEDKKYVLMNAPKEKLDEIVSVLPGMKSPTVMPWRKKAGARYIPYSTRNVSGR